MFINIVYNDIMKVVMIWDY